MKIVSPLNNIFFEFEIPKDMEDTISSLCEALFEGTIVEFEIVAKQTSSKENNNHSTLLIKPNSIEYTIREAVSINNLFKFILNEAKQIQQIADEVITVQKDILRKFSNNTPTIIPFKDDQTPS